MSTNSNNNGSSTGSDQYATYQTQQYINKINKRLSSAKSQLRKYTAELNLAKNQKANITDEYNRSKKTSVQTASNLAEAIAAKEKIEALKEFFNSRKGTTEVMVGVSKTMALKIYEATRFVAGQGIERIEEILALAKSANKIERLDPDQQWTSLFMQATEDADVKGLAALKAAATATSKSFEALVTNLQVNYRTHMFYNQFKNYQEQLQTIVNRLTNENGLANAQFIKMQGELKTIEDQVNSLNDKVDEFTFIVDQLNAEFLAAQQGADYSIKSSSPAS